MNKKQMLQEFTEVYYGDKYNLQRAVDQDKVKVRGEFLDYIDYLAKDGRITERQRNNTCCPSSWYQNQDGEKLSIFFYIHIYSTVWDNPASGRNFLLIKILLNFFLTYISYYYNIMVGGKVMNRKELLEALQTNRICDYIAEHYYESNTYELKELLLSVLYIGYDRL